MKKAIVALLALIMVLSLMPMAVMAEETQERLPVHTLYVGTVNALETPQGDGWSFDASTNTLTLNNCTLTESMLHVEKYEDDEGNVYYSRYNSMIYFDGILTIELIGTNSVERVVEKAPGDYTHYYAIYGGADIPEGWDGASLTFTGSGNLTVGLAVTADSVSEDGWNMKDSWDYFEFSSGIGVWAGVDLSGLYGGGWMDIYGGIYGVQAPYIVKAFANYPTFGDNCIVTAYRDVEGTVENEYGYNWNNNDAWRMKVVTGNAIMQDNGQLILMDTDSASGEGWTWENNILTLSEGTEVKAVDFRSRVGSAKLVLTGDVTLDSTGMGYDSEWNYYPAINASCDLEIDAGAYTLTLSGEDTALKMHRADLLISGGSVVTDLWQYCLSIDSSCGDVTIRNATFRTTCIEEGDELVSGELTLAYDYDEDGNEIPGGDLLIENSTLDMIAGICTNDGSLTVKDSVINMTLGYQGIGCSYADMCFQDSDITIFCTGTPLEASHGEVVFDNCNLDLTGGEGEPLILAARYYEDNKDYEYATDRDRWEPDLNAIRFQNMDITEPAYVKVGYVEEEGYYTALGYTVLLDGSDELITTLKAAAGGKHTHAHDTYGSDGENHWSICQCGQVMEGTTAAHSYTQGLCACTKVQTFTITWKNDDGTVLEVDTVEYGDHPEYNGPTPTKTGEGYDYTFKAWSNGTQYTDVANVKVTCDWTYTACYTGTIHYLPVILMDGDVELGRQEVHYNRYNLEAHLADWAGNPTKACYTLSGWAYADGTIATNFYMPDETVVLYAVWDGPDHTWVDATCQAPKTCSVCGETEGQALPDHTYVEGVCACGKKQTFTITWVNWDGIVLETDIVEYGVVPTYDGATPTRPNVGYEFNFYGWGLSASSAEVTPGAATKNVTYYAKYTSTVHKQDLIFMDGETELARMELYYNKYVYVSAATLNGYAGYPTKDCYTLSGWAYADGTLVTSAFYMPDEAVVMYAVWDGPDHTFDGGSCTVCGAEDPDYVPPVVITKVDGVTATNITRESFDLTWNAAGGAEKYWVFINGVPYCSATGNTVTVEGREAAATYSVAVTALLGDGTVLALADADVIEVTTEGYTVSCTATVDAYSVSLDWEAEDCTKAWLYYGTDADNLKLYTSSTDGKFFKGGLTPNTTYYFQIAYFMGEVKDGEGMTTTQGQIVLGEVFEITTENDDALNVTLEGNTLTWSAVEDSTKYWVTVSTGGKEYIYATTETAFTLSRFTAEQLADATVTVRGYNSSGVYNYNPVA